jgi:hypothetical protein
MTPESIHALMSGSGSASSSVLSPLLTSIVTDEAFLSAWHATKNTVNPANEQHVTTQVLEQH